MVPTYSQLDKEQDLINTHTQYRSSRDKDRQHNRCAAIGLR